ncbi:hypothetical protein KCP69_05395 [Salmonella enterica subsp. enterica]|nr:hypothetical protein KCP69_05395 [Salmonella enterica subsp. enterica]
MITAGGSHYSGGSCSKRVLLRRSPRCIGYFGGKIEGISSEWLNNRD